MKSHLRGILYLIAALQSTAGFSRNIRMEPIIRQRVGMGSRLLQAKGHPSSLSNTASFTSFSNILSSCVICSVIARVLLACSWTHSRRYDREANSVGREYDAWTKEGILEHYWGDHIHLGYYENTTSSICPPKTNFKQAKIDFVEQMLQFGHIKTDSNKPTDLGTKSTQPLHILDVGCGIGGTSRYLAKVFPNTTITGITLSAAQADRARQLAAEQSLPNVQFQVMDAMNMSFPANSFDVVWACESSEHIPDKKLLLQEVIRVLKPEGRFILAAWCQRDHRKQPFTAEEEKELKFLYDEWSHPSFISMEAYQELLQMPSTDTGKQLMEDIRVEDWTKATLPSWLHSIWVGIVDPWIVLRQPRLWYKTYREALTIYRMHKAFQSGLMQYGLLTAKKKRNNTVERGSDVTNRMG